MELQTDDKSEAQKSSINETTNDCNDLTAKDTSSGTKRSHDGERKNGSAKDYLFMKKAIEVSKPSRDPKVKVGACIVSADGVIVGTGCNNMPAGSKDGDLPWGKKNENELKNKKFYVCHAEMNAVLNKNRMDIRNCTMYVTLFPCNECAKIIIESGIKEVVYLSDKNMTQVVTETARIMFELCKIKYRKLNESAFIGL